MILKPYLIDYAAKLLIDNQLWAHAKLAVQTVATNNSDLSGEQKHQIAKEQILEFIGDIAASLINLAIELAVIYLKSKQK